ncbi:NAD(+) synthase [Clostridium botulinum]|uniref:NAD(+) synthase n=1 Tax=Clostridium botulinum TaxID=1491 RepID=UPI0004B14B15|nr:NAD(+) synthase [Clostridium botulinum]QDY27045.1 NAD(+) synthase [Clostridium botulinum]
MERDFDAKIETEKVITWIREYFDKQPSVKGAILGISGGKDSTVVSSLLVKALGKDRVFGVLMPNGEQKDIKDSLEVVKLLGIDFCVVNIEEAYNGIINNTLELSEQALVNIAPRLRMTTLYGIGQTKGYRVAGTGNKSEAYVGYTTKWGDSACDFNPIAEFNTEDVLAIGDYLGLPYDLVHKTPSDGLCGKSDEINLGFKYSQVNKFMDTGDCGDEEINNKIKERHEISSHKRNPIPIYKR